MQTQKKRPVHSRIKRFVRRAAVLTVSGVGVVVAVPTVAAAGTDITGAEAYSSDCDQSDRLAAKGGFRHYGDTFWVYDDCADGHSVQLQVDIEPFGTSSHYDFKFTNSGGYGVNKTLQFNVHEGTALSVRACVSEGSTTINCGTWHTGMA